MAANTLSLNPNQASFYLKENNFMLLTNYDQNPSAHDYFPRHIYSDKKYIRAEFLHLIHNFHFTTPSWPAKPVVFIFQPISFKYLCRPLTQYQRVGKTQGWQPYQLYMPTVLKSENLNLLEPSGPFQVCNGIAFTYTASLGATNPGRQFALATRFWTVATKICWGLIMELAFVNLLVRIILRKGLHIGKH